MNMRNGYWVTAIGLAALASGTAAGQSLTARSSTVNFSYVYGAGGDVNSGGQNIPDTSLVPTDTEGTGYTGSTSGSLPGGPYAAGVFSDIEHQYVITGLLPKFDAITGSGSSQVTASASGLGTAQMLSSNPGNQLRFNFDVTNPGRYQLTGSVITTQPGAFSYVALQRFDGITWAQVFNSIFLPGNQGSFDVTGALTPGSYRIDAALSSNATGNAAHSGSFQYTLRILRPGDMNCDGKVDGLDIQAFVWALLNPAGYAAAYPGCSRLNGDLNNDSAVNQNDLAPFVQCVLNGGC